MPPPAIFTYQRNKPGSTDTVFDGFHPDFAGDGALLELGYPLRQSVWHARSKDGRDRLSSLPDELLHHIFDLTKWDFDDICRKKDLDLSHRLLPFSRRQLYQYISPFDLPTFRLLARTVLAQPSLAALVRCLKLTFALPKAEEAFGSSEERVAFWKAMVNVQELEIGMRSGVLPTEEELAQFGAGEQLERVAWAKVAEGTWYGRRDPPAWTAAQADLYKCVLLLAPSLEKLEVCVVESMTALDGAASAQPGRFPALTSLRLDGRLARASQAVAGLVGAFPNLAKLDLHECVPGLTLDGLLDGLALAGLAELRLTTTATEWDDDPFSWNPAQDPLPLLTTNLASLTSLESLHVFCSTHFDWLLTLPKSLERFSSGPGTAITPATLARLLTPGDAAHLPALRVLDAYCEPPELDGAGGFGRGLQLGRARIPYLPVLATGVPDFSLKGLWNEARPLPEGEWGFDAVEQVVRLADAGGVDLKQAPWLYGYRFEAARRAELDVRAELERRWEAGELVWRKDTKEVARTMGHQKQTGETPEPEPYQSRKRKRGTRPEGVKKTKNRKRHRKST